MFDHLAVQDAHVFAKSTYAFARRIGGKHGPFRRAVRACEVGLQQAAFNEVGSANLFLYVLCDYARFRPIFTNGFSPGGIDLPIFDCI